MFIAAAPAESVCSIGGILCPITIFATTAIVSGARKGFSRSFSICASADRFAPSRRRAKHLAQPLAGLSTNHEEAPGTQLPVVGRAHRRVEDQPEVRIGRSGFAQHFDGGA